MPHPRRSPQELGFPTRAISAAGTTVSSILPLATDTSSLVTSTSTNAASSSVVAPTSSASSSSASVPTSTKSASFYHLLSSYPGEITGITVGAAVLGSLLTAIMFWLWMGRSFRRRGSHSSIDDFLMLQPRETPSAPAKDTIPTLDDSLPKGTDDKTIVESMRNINGLIETYVEEYVTMTAIPGLDERDVSKIKEKVEKALTVYIDQSSQMPVNELSELLVDAQSRKSAVRYLIGWMLFSSITNYGDPRRTLLPTELIIFMNSIPPPTADRQCEYLWRLQCLQMLIMNSISSSPWQVAHNKHFLVVPSKCTFAEFPAWKRNPYQHSAYNDLPQAYPPTFV